MPWKFSSRIPHFPLFFFPFLLSLFFKKSLNCKVSSINHDSFHFSLWKKRKRKRKNMILYEIVFLRRHNIFIIIAFFERSKHDLSFFALSWIFFRTPKIMIIIHELHRYLISFLLPFFFLFFFFFFFLFFSLRQEDKSRIFIKASRTLWNLWLLL